MNKDNYENLLFENDFQVKQLKLAFSIVKKFIQFNKRIMFGGMAIDHALRLKDDKLYPDNKLPDYDFLSPIFHIDAYSLGEQLVENGLTGISVIRGQHVSTMKVRLNFVDVADIGYIPQKIYDKIPTILYDGIYNVHPHFQYIDQHRALSIPFENPPRESFLNRWEKDIKRITLLNKYYKLTTKSSDKKLKTLTFSLKKLYENIEKVNDIVNEVNESENGDGEVKNDDVNNNGDVSDEEVKNEANNNKVNKDDKSKRKKKVKGSKEQDEICLGGLPALAYWLNEAKKYKYTNNTVLEIKGDKITIPEKYPFTILSYNNINIKGNKKYYNSILEKIPKRTMIHFEDLVYEILHTQNNLVSAHRIVIDGNTLYVANLQHIMCYLLCIYFVSDDNMYLYYYTVAYDLLIFMCNKYNDITKEENNNSEVNDIKHFLPSVEIYGDRNISDSYEIYLQTTLFQIDNEKYIIDAPKDAFPSFNKKISDEYYEYDPALSEFYQIDGEETKKFD